MSAYDNSGKGDNGGSGNISASFSISGVNPILFVAAGHNGSITSITYNGVALTKLNSQVSGSYGTSELWYLVGPATGANTLAITVGSGFCTATWASYSGAKQAGFPDAQSKQDPTNPSSPMSTALTTVADNCWTVGLYYCAMNAGQNFAAGTGTTLRQSNQYNSSGTLYTVALADSNGVKTPAGVQSLAVTFPGAPADIANIMASFAPDGSGTLTLNSKRW